MWALAETGSWGTDRSIWGSSGRTSERTARSGVVVREVRFIQIRERGYDTPSQIDAIVGKGSRIAEPPLISRNRGPPRQLRGQVVAVGSFNQPIARGADSQDD